MDEFSVTLMRTKLTPGTVRYDAVEDEDAFLRNVCVNKRAFKVTQVNTISARRPALGRQ
jgi:superfamily II helicase